MRLFFLDIDGTIAVPGTDPSPMLRETVAALQRQGDRVFLCTGRTEEFTPPSVRALGCDGGIYSAGGFIRVGSRELFEAFLPERTQAEVLSLLKRLSANYTLECRQGSYWGGTDLHQLLTQMDPKDGMHSELLRLLTVVQDRLPIARYDGRPVFKIVFVLPSREAADALPANLPQGTHVVFFQNKLAQAQIYLGEISSAQINKATAMHRLCRYYGLRPEDCVAYGDSMNDAEILLAAGEGVAMGNAGTDVKRLANRICGSCAEDGLALDLRRYISSLPN